MTRRPPRSTRTDTLFPYTTLFRAGRHHLGHQRDVETVILEARKIAEHVEHLPDRRDIIVHLREQLRRVRAVRNRRLARSEERRGGKECVSKGRCRWSPYH